MGTYLHLFKTQNDFESVYSDEERYIEPWTSLVKENGNITFNKPIIPPHDYSQDYLTFKIQSDGDIIWHANESVYAKTISYSKDDGKTWTEVIATTGTDKKITVIAGDVVLFKGNNDSYINNSFSGTTCEFEIEGNIMSLINEISFNELTTFTTNNVFNGLFQCCKNLKRSENLILPVTELTNSCYNNMFYECISLTTAPILPATKMKDYCYCQMFTRCISLTTAPELPATTLANRCYYNMFVGCTSLTTAPELPATTLAYSCYYRMFNGCSSLNYIKCLATDISATNCTQSWVYGVPSSTGTFVKNPNMTSWGSGYNGIPNGWTVQDATE